MSIRMMNPVAQTHSEALRRPVRIEEFHGRRLGLLFNGHVSAGEVLEAARGSIRGGITVPEVSLLCGKKIPSRPPQPRVKLPNSRRVQSWSL